jgi:hypothetical protein
MIIVTSELRGSELIMYSSSLKPEGCMKSGLAVAFLIAEAKKTTTWQNRFRVTMQDK